MFPILVPKVLLFSLFSKVIQVMYSFNRIKVPVKGMVKMMPWFSSMQKKFKNVSDVSQTNITLSRIFSMISSLQIYQLSAACISTILFATVAGTC